MDGECIRVRELIVVFVRDTCLFARAAVCAFFFVDCEVRGAWDVKLRSCNVVCACANANHTAATIDQVYCVGRSLVGFSLGPQDFTVAGTHSSLSRPVWCVMMLMRDGRDEALARGPWGLPLAWSYGGGNAVATEVLAVVALGCALFGCGHVYGPVVSLDV